MFSFRSFSGRSFILNDLSEFWGALQPFLELHDSNGTLLAANDNWKSTQQAAIAATGLAPTNDAEAAILATLAPGAYTAIQSGVNGGTGVGLVEVYNLH